MNYLDTLNPRQYEAVTASDGATLVLAGPGSGKTRVLTQRIVYLIREKSVRPYEIMAVTFTNKAAREMQDRVEDLLELQLKGTMWLGTFHAICGRILRREAEYLPFDHNFVIMDSDDQQSLIKRVIRDLNLNDKTFRPGSVQGEISKAKNNLQFPADFVRSNYREETIFRIYEQYQLLLQKSNAVDFDDMLLYCWKLLQDNEGIRQKYGNRFRHVLVDEFQDTNTVQYELLKHFSSVNGNLFAVGDEDQSIYRWRGADYRNVLQFEKDFPDLQKILLEQNYRSTQNVLDAARAVIDHNQNRTPKKLFSDRGKGNKVIVYEAEDDRMEARYVVDTISQLIANGNAKGEDFAILYRTNAQSRLLEDAFLYRGMGYRLVGAQRFYGRREVKDMIAFLRVVYNPLDEVSLLRIINVPTRGIGEKAISNLRLSALESSRTIGEVLLDLGRYGPDSVFYPEMGRAALPLADFGARVVAWREQWERDDQITDLMDTIIRDTGYEPFIREEDDAEIDRWENVEELKRMAFEYQERGLAEFLQNLALVSDQDTISETTNVPTLMTLHAVKGLEFNNIFIVGLDDGILPHARSLDDPEEMAEERRLFYVGITRARNNLTLVRAVRRMTYGSPEINIPSRFLSYLPSELVISTAASFFGLSGERTSYTPASRWESRPQWADSIRQAFPAYKTTTTAAAKAIVERKFEAQDVVEHPMWGEGTVMESVIEDGEEVVQVRFKNGATKRLIVSLSKIRKSKAKS